MSLTVTFDAEGAKIRRVRREDSNQDENHFYPTVLSDQMRRMSSGYGLFHVITCDERICRPSVKIQQGLLSVHPSGRDVSVGE
jgi:hypothetical protein